MRRQLGRVVTQQSGVLSRLDYCNALLAGLPASILQCICIARGSTGGAKKLGLKERIALNGTPVTELQDVVCHIGSHSVTCYPTQVNAPRPNSIYLPRKVGHAAELKATRQWNGRDNKSDALTTTPLSQPQAMHTTMSLVSYGSYFGYQLQQVSITNSVF